MVSPPDARSRSASKCVLPAREQRRRSETSNHMDMSTTGPTYQPVRESPRYPLPPTDAVQSVWMRTCLITVAVVAPKEST